MRREIIVNLTANILYYSGIVFLFNLITKIKKPKKVAILMYHSIQNSKKGQTSLYYQKVISSSPNDFEKQIIYLKKRFNIISLDEYVTIVKNKRIIPRNCVIITFDDGYRDNYINAYPILRKYNVPATIFITTGKIGSKEPLWGAKVAYYINSTMASEINLDGIGKYRLDSDSRKLKAIDDIIERLKLINEIKRDIVIDRLAEQLKVEKVDKAADVLFLSWDEIRDISTNSISFGAHTVSHPNLASISVDQAKREVVESKYRIEVETDRSVNCFAYPYGGLVHFNERIKTMLREAGFICACSTIYGRQNLNDDLYQLRRIPIFHYHNMSVFKAKVFGFFDYLDRLEKLLVRRS